MKHDAVTAIINVLHRKRPADATERQLAEEILFAARGDPLEHRLVWPAPDEFDQRACDYLAEKYSQQGFETDAGCIALGMPIDHESHVVVTAITEFMADLDANGSANRRELAESETAVLQAAWDMVEAWEGSKYGQMKAQVDQASKALCDAVSDLAADNDGERP